VTRVRSNEPAVRDQPPPKWIDAAPGVRMRPLVEGVGVTLVLYQMEPGTRFDAHRHEFGELGVVLQGAGYLTVEGEERELRAGESYYLPPNSLHGLTVAEGSEPMVMIDVAASLPADLPVPPLARLTELTASVVHRPRTIRRY
jgi:quercetin dioxygenase-like cupin family protein